MGLLTRAFKPRGLSLVPGGVSSYAPSPFGSPSTSFQAAARAYSGNEIVSAGVNLLATSSGEPQIIGRRYRRNRAQIRTEMRYLNAFGIKNSAGRMVADAVMVRNGFWEEVDNAPLVKLLNNPNPYRSRAQFWSEVIVDLYLAGNAYVLKARYQDGMLDGATGELWRLSPARVRPIPGDMEAGEPFLKGYEYTIDSRTKRTIPVEDVLHFKTRNPLDPYQGLSPVATLLPRVAVDTYMRTLLSTFYARGGAGVGGMLNIKGEGNKRLDQQQKDDMRERFRRIFSGGQYDILVTSAEDASYTQFGMDRGLRDALPKEIDAVNEARIAMILGIPGSILGLLIGYESSSYANKRQDWQVFWDITMAPLLTDLASVINLGLTPEFKGVDEIAFDLSDIRALQEDEDKLQDRARKNFEAGGWSLSEFRMSTGMNPEPEADALFFVRGGTAVIPAAQLPESSTTQRGTSATAVMRQAVAMMERAEEIDSPRGGRPRIEDDEAARAIYDQAIALRERFPHLTWEQIAARVSISDRTLREYRRRFTDDEDPD